MLPIKRVVLFKHGVGYFQRAGTVEGDQLVELSFKADQMNDVLKSLTALDFGGGTFAALSYDSEEPIEKRLAELTMSIPEKGAISAFLDRLKGARVSLKKGDTALEGSIIGIEEVERMQEGAKVRDAHLALLAEGERLERVPLLEMSSLSFLDESIQRDLKTLLDVLFSGLCKDRKRLSIQTQGQGSRDVSLSYVIEAPVWKTSYRIMLPAGDGEKPLIQGWALVDNTTEDDWEGVRLSLVAGLPISFIHDLYTPRYRRRPVVRVEEEAAVAPPIVEGAMMEAMEAEEDAEEYGKAYVDEIRTLADVAPCAAAPPPRAMARAARSSVEVQTRTQEVGDLFAYVIIRPVDIGRSRSAMVPILQNEMDLERVALYNAGIREKNPMTAFRIKNTTGLTLEGGPVTVFEGDSYVGEAMLDTLRKEEERFTPYSVELGITVKHDEDYFQEDYTRATKSGNYIYKHFRRLLATTYEFSSTLDRSVATYIDHPFQYRTYEDTPKPMEVTENFWRFKIDAAPKKTTKFVVKEVSETHESVEITGIARTAIHQMFKEKLISESVKAELERIAAQVESIQKIDEEIEKRKKQRTDIEKGQARLRENLKVLKDTSQEKELREKYVSTLAREEEKIEQLRKEGRELKDQLKEERKRLKEMVDALKLR